MKNILILIFTLATIALGAVCVWQSHKLADQKLQLTVLRHAAEQQSRELADLQSSQKFLEQQNSELFAQTSQLAGKLQVQQRAAGGTAAATGVAGTAPGTNHQKSASDKNPLGQFLAKMMEDPETRKMIREQQRLMLDQLYGPLTKQMGLSPEESEQFKNLLADNLVKSTEQATALLGGESSTNRAEKMARLAAEQKGFDEQVRTFLGETRYAQYQDYQQTVGERSQLNQFRQQFAVGENALTDQQTEQLLAFMKEEKQAVNATGGFGSSGVSQDTANLQALMSGDGVDQIFKSQETVNQRVYERARTVLAENQLTAFGKFQASQLQMMRMGMSMARQAMAPEGGQGATTPSR